MKKAFKNIIKTITPLLACFGFLPTLKENNKYASTILDSDVDEVFYSLVDSQDDICQHTFSTVYFNNLTKNFGENTHGTCSFVAIEMLLTFYDTYWNDAFVDESYDNPTIINSESTNIALTQTLPSPGVRPNLISETANMSNLEYQEYIEENCDSDLQCYLINYADNMFGFNLNNQNPYSLNLTQELNLLYYYLVYSRSITTNLFTLDSVDDSCLESEINSFVVSNILNGVPVVLNISSDLGNHTVIAYDVDEFDNIYIHSGWKDDYGNALTHALLEDIPNSEIESAFAMIMTNSYSFTNNYQNLSGNVINIKNFGFPSNVRETGAPRMVVEWDSLWNEKWFEYDNEQISFQISFLSENLTALGTYSVSESNIFVCSLRTFTTILQSADEDDDCFVIKLEAFCNTDSHFGEDYSKILNVTVFSDMHTISPNECDLSLNYSTSAPSSCLPECETNDGYVFRRSVKQASCFLNNIVLSASGNGNSEAYIEYQFLSGICRFDVDISYFSNPMLEGLTDGVFEARIEEFRGRQYTTLIDLLDDDVHLSHDRNSKTTISLFFNRPTFRIRIYLKTSTVSYENINLGRICIGDVKVFDSNQFCLPLSGWELDFDINLWHIGSVRQSHNCYTYAVNYYPNNLCGEWCNQTASFNPGEYSNPDLYNLYYSLEFFDGTPFYYSPTAILRMVAEDFDSGIFGDGNFIIKRTNKTDMCEEGTYKIALVFDHDSVSPDYHWLRQNSDGSWSHKMAGDEPTSNDGDGNIIWDPENCNLDLEFFNYENNQFDVAYFMVTPILVLGEEY